MHRTGGTTIENLLKSHFDNNIKLIYQHDNAKTSKSYLLDKFYDYYKFGFTRNPWGRMLSWYSLIHKNQAISLVEERKRFELFIKSNAASNFTSPYFHYNSIDYFTNINGELKVDKIFRYENFNLAVQEILDHCNLPSVEVPQLNSTDKKDYRDYYTKSSKALIAEKCSLDIEYFDYKF